MLSGPCSSQEEDLPDIEIIQFAAEAWTRLGPDTDISSVPVAHNGNAGSQSPSNPKRLC